MRISIDFPAGIHTIFAADAFKNVVGTTTNLKLGPEEVTAKIISAEVINFGRDVKIELEF